MIDYLDNLLRHLFLAQMEQITDEAQVRFQPPDEQWRLYVANLNRQALNLYLFDLHENRKLRSNERMRGVHDGIVSEEPAPRRMDCHYLVTAWSPSMPSPALEPTLEEQALLYQVTAVLMNSEPLIPSKVYWPDPLPATFPEVIAEAELPTTILPAEGFPKLGEFWGAMGNGGRWKPGVYLVVTLPVVLEKWIAGPMVTTRITEYRQSDQLETAEAWIQIGGHVLDASLDPPLPVVKAWVRLERMDGKSLQTAETNELGRYTFGGLRVGAYRLRSRAVGLGEVERDVEVTSPTGEYDLKFD